MNFVDSENILKLHFLLFRSINRPAQTKPNQSLGNKFGLRDYVRAGKQIKVCSL